MGDNRLIVKLCFLERKIQIHVFDTGRNTVGPGRSLCLSTHCGKSHHQPCYTPLNCMNQEASLVVRHRLIKITYAGGENSI